MLDGLKDKMKTTANIIQKGSKDITKVTHIKFKIGELNTKIEKQKMLIGCTYYDALKLNGKICDDDEVKINEYIKNIDEYEKEKEKLQEEIKPYFNNK